MLIAKVLVLGLLVVYGWSMSQVGPLNGFGKLVVAQLLASVPLLYFLPTWEAWERKHTNLTGVTLLNLLLGWTLVGWVAALVWSCWRTSAPHGEGQAEPIAQSVSDGEPVAETKTCPFCAEKVLAAAIKCKHCGSDLREAA